MKEAFVLPEKSCERLTRTEMNAVKLTISLTSVVNYAREDLVKKLEVIPDGIARMNAVTNDLNELLQDILGTVSYKQSKQLLNDAKDLEIRLVPKMTSDNASVLFKRDEFESLINCAREKCKFCTEDGRSCERCDLYRILEAKVPLEDYGDGIACPYAYTEWE